MGSGVLGDCGRRDPAPRIDNHPETPKLELRHMRPLIVHLNREQDALCVVQTLGPNSAAMSAAPAREKAAPVPAAHVERRDLGAPSEQVHKHERETDKRNPCEPDAARDRDQRNRNA